MSSSTRPKAKLPALALAALGVVYGDIGTSPLYTMKEVFAVSQHPVPLNPDNILGILSLIVWALIMVVSVKYVAFIMRADNRGEGGIMALLALALRNLENNPKKHAAIVMTGIIGACMFYADGTITPAISVLSAIEGLEVAAPQLHSLIVPISLIVLFLLFWVQSKGTALVGALFGPIMLLWFGTLAVLGLIHILEMPSVLRALNPFYGVHFFALNPWLSFVALGSVVLAVTGAEALYADMGHFGRKPIQLVWFCFVLPALILNYFGQGALLLLNPDNIKNPFYLMAPEWMLYPLIVLATLAAVIASQAVISGAFSVSRQALQLGFLPRMLVEHTSSKEEGQIYMPRINWGLMIGVMILVLMFRSSGNLAAAYGIAVTGDMVITTTLAGIVFHGVYGWGTKRTSLIILLFLSIDLAFFSANLLKVPDGGWVPILVGAIIFTLMTTWKTGRKLLMAKLKSESMELSPFVEAMGKHAPTRVPGNAIFLTPNPNGVPHALLHNLKHNKVLHEKVILLTVKVADYPHIAKDERLSIEKLPHEFYQITMHYGFADNVDLPVDLEKCSAFGLLLDPMETSFFVGKEVLIPNRNSEMLYWRQKIFATLFRNADTASNYFKLPPNRVVELGAQISL